MPTRRLDDAGIPERGRGYVGERTGAWRPSARWDPGSHFLGCAHTQANFETAFYRSTIADNNSFEQWQSEGGLDAAARANALYKRMLDGYEPPPIDPAMDEALLDFMDAKKRAVPDANY